jgi:hypothetical protein
MEIDAMLPTESLNGTEHCVTIANEMKVTTRKHLHAQRKMLFVVTE